MRSYSGRAILPRIAACAAVLLLMMGGASTARAAEPIRACVTVPDLASLLRSVGGEAVEVTTFARDTEDPHFVEPRPSFIRSLSRADLFVQIGLELESGWVPNLLRNSRNQAVQRGGKGYVDASSAIEPIGAPSGEVDRSEGDVHPLGNPHYLLDPVNGYRVTRLLRDKLIELRPDQRETFDRNHERFAQRLGEALVGSELAETYDAEKLALLQTHGKLMPFLEQQGHANQLGGWLGAAERWRGAAVVADHNMWNYFARRFNLEVIGYMEPKPGLTPTTSHLRDLVGTMQSRDVGLVLSSVYFDDRYAAFLGRNTEAEVVQLAHQVEALPEAESYPAVFEHNIDRLKKATAAE